MHDRMLVQKGLQGDALGRQAGRGLVECGQGRNRRHRGSFPLETIPGQFLQDGLEDPRIAGDFDGLGLHRPIHAG